MTEHERLVEMIDNSNACICVDADKLTDYLLQNGVIVPPCKVGDTVYRVDRYEYCDIDECYRCFTELQEAACKYHHVEYKLYETKFQISFLNGIGKTVFLTREEAEKALGELKRNEKYTSVCG